MIKRQKKYKNRFFSIIILMLLLLHCQAQIIVDSTSSLLPFWQKLELVEEKSDSLITILHLGDSHLQAGYLPATIRDLLQTQFGNAGRGWIAPYRLIRTNQPIDYSLKANKRYFRGSKLTNRRPAYPIGPGGITLYCNASSLQLELTTASKKETKNIFQTVLLYRSPQSMPLIPKGKTTVLAQATKSRQGLLIDTFKLANKSNQLSIQSTRKDLQTGIIHPLSFFRSYYYGFSLLNNQRGLLYHAIGVNGATFLDWSKKKVLEKMIPFQPDLIIISLGTNETFGRYFSEKEFKKQISQFISLLQQTMPHSSLLFTTPPECYKKRYSRKRGRYYVQNKNSSKAANAIISFAKENDIAYWNMYEDTGGEGSYQRWEKEKLTARDHIHFTSKGYQKQGHLFFQAIFNSYNRYKKESTHVRNY